MKLHRIILAGLLLAVLAIPAQAQLVGRSPEPVHVVGPPEVQYIGRSEVWLVPCEVVSE